MRKLLNFIPFNLPRPTVKMRRRYVNDRYCISHLYDGKNGTYLCDAIEDTVRDANHNGVFDPGEEKVYGKTAIPCGRYYVTFRKTKLKIGKKAKDGVIPLLHNVPSFEFIRIHPGETEKDSEGCIILGYNKVAGRVVDSEAACLKFYDQMKYRPFWLEITDEFAVDEEEAGK